MARYRNRLPQLNGGTVLTDGGLETVMIFQEGVELPLFAAFDLVRHEEGRARLRAYFQPYIAIAKEAKVGLLLESVTWRASADWGAQLGLLPHEIAAINRDAIAFLEEMRDAHETADSPMVISGCVGPRGDGYAPDVTMTAVEAEARLPSGDALADAVAAVDDATGGYPAYFMINCAHPTHFAHVLGEVPRVRGLRANASRCSHAELDNSETLDTGDPEDLGRRFGEMMRAHPQLSVIGGCCGTDHRHIAAIGRALAGDRAAA